MRRIERTGEIAAMQEELRHAQTAISALRSDKVLAPLYHLPLNTFKRALPKLIGEGKLMSIELGALVKYEMRAEEINRGLALAVQVSAGNHTLPGVYQTLQQLHQRNVGKAAYLHDEKHAYLDNSTVLEAAAKALSRLAAAKRSAH